MRHHHIRPEGRGIKCVESVIRADVQDQRRPGRVGCTGIRQPQIKPGYWSVWLRLCVSQCTRAGTDLPGPPRLHRTAVRLPPPPTANRQQVIIRCGAARVSVLA